MLNYVHTYYGIKAKYRVTKKYETLFARPKRGLEY